MSKKCLECGDEIFGRVDKKFCGDQCRNNYNNKRNSDSTQYIRNTNRILRSNRRILEQLTTKDKAKAKATRERLLDRGFNFEYHTSMYTTKDNRTYYYCYDYGYIELDKGWYALVKKKEWA